MLGPVSVGLLRIAPALLSSRIIMPLSKATSFKVYKLATMKMYMHIIIQGH